MAVNCAVMLLLARSCRPKNPYAQQDDIGSLPSVIRGKQNHIAVFCPGNYPPTLISRPFMNLLLWRTKKPLHGMILIVPLNKWVLFGSFRPPRLSASAQKRARSPLAVAQSPLPSDFAKSLFCCHRAIVSGITQRCGAAAANYACKLERQL